MKRIILFLCILVVISMLFGAFAIAENEDYAFANVDPTMSVLDGGCFGMDVNDVLSNMQKGVDYDVIEGNTHIEYVFNEPYSYMDFPGENTYYSVCTAKDSSLIDQVIYSFSCPVADSDLLEESVKNIVDEVKKVYGEPTITFFKASSEDDVGRSYTESLLCLNLRYRVEGEYWVEWATNDMYVIMDINIDRDKSYDTGYISFFAKELPAVNDENITQEKGETYALKNVDPFGLLENGGCFGLDINHVLWNLEENTDYQKTETNDNDTYYLNDYFYYMEFPEAAASCSFMTPSDSDLINGISYHFICPSDSSTFLSGSIKKMIEEIEQVYGTPMIIYYPDLSSDEYRSLTKTTLIIGLNSRSEGQYMVFWRMNGMTIILSAIVDGSQSYDGGQLYFELNNEYANDRIDPMPMDVNNGDIIIATDYEGVCPLTVKTASDTNYYVYLDYISAPLYTKENRRLARQNSSSNNDNLSFYIASGQTVEIDVPIGYYKFYYATGDVFYGPEILFGQDTKCYSSDEYLAFYADDKYYKGHTLTLYPVVNGDFETDSIDAEEFPTH